MVTEQLLGKKEGLERTRADLQGKLDAVLADLDRLTDDDQGFNPRAAGRLIELEREASALSGSISRLDEALTVVGRDLSAAQAAAEEVARLDALESAARAAEAATALEQRIYDDLALELEGIFARILDAHDHGRAARQHLRAKLNAAAPALIVLGAPTTFSAAREAEADRIETTLSARGVDLRRALESDARLRFGAVLWPLINEWNAARPLEAA